MGRKNGIITIREDKRYHDTMLLLRKYRDIVWGIAVETEQIRSDFISEYGKTIDEFLDEMYCAGVDLGGTELEDRTRCIARSRKMIKLLDITVEQIRQRSGGELMYQILYFSYLTKENLTTPQIISRLEEKEYFISESTLFRKRNEAVSLVSTVLWGYTSKECKDILISFVD